MTYYLIIDDFEFKLASTSVESLEDNEGIEDSYHDGIYYCIGKCRNITGIIYYDKPRIALQIYQKYN